MSAERNDLLETVEPKVRPANQAIVANTWLQSDGLGGFVPLQPSNPVVGLALEGITSADPSFTSSGLIHVDMVTSTIDRFLMDVTEGLADETMIGLAWDVDATNPGGLDVSQPPASGTGQFEIIRVITATKVEVRPLVCCDVPVSAS